MATRKRRAEPQAVDRVDGSIRSNRELTPTDTPGVFRNRAGVLVAKNGVALSFAALKKLDTQRIKEVLGEEAETPADLLKAVAFDPRLPLLQRVDAAKSAAPFFSAKKVAIQGGGDGAPPIAVKLDLGKLSKAELDKLEQLLSGVDKLVEKAQ